MEKVWFLTEKCLRVMGLVKFGNAVESVRVNGGLNKSYLKLAKSQELKIGTLVGTDDFGNRYFENNYYFFGKNRWVEYADHVGFNYDASQITPEWYGWLHYKTDYLPTNDPTRPNYPWILKASENWSGTNRAYVGYNTMKPKIELWEPKSKKRL